MSSVWIEGTRFEDFPTLEGDAETDVLIIGGGIVGILTAYFLDECGIPYILVEKNKLCGGTTQNTTAKITYSHGLIYDKLSKDLGVEGARLYFEANRSAFEKFAQMCKDIDCDYERKDNFVYSTDDRQKLESELSAAEKIGCNAKLCENVPLPIKTVGAVCFPSQAQFDPLKFLSVISKGLNIYENTFVIDVDGGVASTQRGKIHAKRVIVATHFPFINRHGMFFLKLHQHRSYVTVLEGCGDVGGMYVDESKTGFSFRNYKNLLFVGGGAHRTGEKGGGYDEVRRFTAKNYPNATEKFHWATQDCMSLDSMPYIGSYSKNTPRMYTAAGFNKWGMTSSMLSAMLLCDMMQDKKNEYAELFSPQRSILKPQLAVNGAVTLKNMLTPTTKRCTHLGCALKYNTAEHTWDCACHGSRFDCDGEVIDNPAKKRLGK